MHYWSFLFDDYWCFLIDAWWLFSPDANRNIFLATKLEQEYIIALSEQCNYMENSVIKTMQKNIVMAKYEEWEKELVYTSSLTDRIKDNIEKF